MKFVQAFLLLASLSIGEAFGAAKSPSPEARAWVREWVMSRASPFQTSAAPEANDQAASLVDEFVHRNLAVMEKEKLQSAKLESAPWSDSYWPTFAGQVANRYGDKGYFEVFTWKENKEYLLKHLGKGDDGELSPAEKYDLLVGDRAFTLTKAMINAGAPYADEKGEVERWMGLCHGWAPAAFMLPRPARSVQVKAADGRPIRFRPSDIKALATLLWAHGAGETKFIGGRCNDKRPDREDTREKKPECRDTNPATWHLAVVNQIAVARRSFVIDATASAEVWNQPVLGYRYSYENPNTDEPAETLAAAKVAVKDLKNDPFAKYRSPEAASVVKLTMALEYLAETNPSTAAEDSPQNDARITVYYHYDLELDANDNIVGGEWRDGANHPDFLWLPVKDSVASSPGDEWLVRQGDRSSWNGGDAVPELWRRVAKATSQYEMPLARIVNRLVELAK